MARTKAAVPATTVADDQFARLVDREVRRVREGLEREREGLRADLTIDVQPLEIACTVVYSERQAYREQTKASDREHNQAMIEFSRRESEARDAAERARAALNHAKRRIAEIDHMIGAEAAAAVALRDRDEILDEIPRLAAEQAKRRATIDSINIAAQQAETSLASARSAELARITQALEAGTQPEVGDGAATLAHLERIEEARRGLLGAAEKELAALAARIAGTAARMEDARARHLAALGGHARLRWLAVQRLIAGEVLAMGLAKRLTYGFQEPTLPQIDDLEAARLAREIESQFRLPTAADPAGESGESDAEPVDGTDDERVEAA